MIRRRQENGWESWLARARKAGVAQDLRRFAEGLARDEDAVRAALALEWSNGQVEGHINRLKLMKRQMFGRAGFELLRRRFLRAA
jgi:transposase